MSKTFWGENGELLNKPVVDDITKCKWLCDEVCCNDKSRCLGDYPMSIEYCEDCEYFEKEC